LAPVLIAAVLALGGTWPGVGEGTWQVQGTSHEQKSARRGSEKVGKGKGRDSSAGLKETDQNFGINEIVVEEGKYGEVVESRLLQVLSGRSDAGTTPDRTSQGSSQTTTQSGTESNNQTRTDTSTQGGSNTQDRSTPTNSAPSTQSGSTTTRSGTTTQASNGTRSTSSGTKNTGSSGTSPTQQTNTNQQNKNTTNPQGQQQNATNTQNQQRNQTSVPNNPQATPVTFSGSNNAQQQQGTPSITFSRTSENTIVFSMYNFQSINLNTTNENIDLRSEFAMNGTTTIQFASRDKTQATDNNLYFTVPSYLSSITFTFDSACLMPIMCANVNGYPSVTVSTTNGAKATISAGIFGIATTQVSSFTTGSIAYPDLSTENAKAYGVFTQGFIPTTITNKKMPNNILVYCPLFLPNTTSWSMNITGVISANANTDDDASANTYNDIDYSGVIIGVAVGCSVFFAVLVASTIAFCIIRRRRLQREKEQAALEDTELQDIQPYYEDKVAMAAGLGQAKIRSLNVLEEIKRAISKPELFSQAANNEDALPSNELNITYPGDISNVPLNPKESIDPNSIDVQHSQEPK